MRTLVVGANGFLARSVVKALREAGHAVRGVHHARTDALPPDLDSVPDDQLESVKDVDWVFLLAAFIPRPGQDADERLVRTNVALPIRVAEAFPSARVVFASSVSVYGTPEGVLTETAAIRSPNPYGRSKLAAECVVRQHPSHAVIRFGSLYGPGMRSSTIVPRFIQQARSNGRLELYGDGSRRQSYLHVRDAASLCLAAAGDVGNAVYLGVGCSSPSNLELAQIVCDAVPGATINRVGVDNAPSWVFDASWSRERLSWQPSVTLSSGISELVAHAV